MVSPSICHGFGHRFVNPVSFCCNPTFWMITRRVLKWTQPLKGPCFGHENGQSYQFLEHHTGVSKKRGTPKWMVYNRKPYWNGWFGGTTIFGNTHTPLWNITQHPTIFDSLGYSNWLSGGMDVLKRPKGLNILTQRRYEFCGFSPEIHSLSPVIPPSYSLHGPHGLITS